MHYLSILTTIATLAVVTLAQVGMSRHPYVHPHEAIHELLQMERASEVMTQAERDEMNAIFEVFSPMNVFQQVLKDGANVSDTCANQTLYALENIAVENGWALDMIDAWGKPHSGIRRLAIMWLGDFEQCVSVQSGARLANSTMTDEQNFEGKYCGLGAPAGFDTVNVMLPTGINVGSCFPSGCSESDIMNLLKPLIDTVNANLTKSIQVNCQEKDMAFSDAAIAAIVLYSVMGGLCLLGTLYDFVFIMTAPDESTPKTVVDDGNLTGRNEAQNHTDTETLIAPTVERRRGALGELLMCFSLYTNGCKLLSTKQAPGSLTCLNGIRFISMTWVILGHTLVFSLGSAENPITLFSWFKRFSFQVVLNGPVCVDSFFVLSAVLITYLFLKEMERKKKTPGKFFLSLPIMYLHRYIRLTPAFGFMILFYACLTLYTYNGPLKPTHTTIADHSCRTYWWASILYVNNIFHTLEQCAPWSWYLSNDFQFYLITPFVAYLMYLVPIAGLVLALVMVITSAGISTGLSIQEDLGVTTFGGRNMSFHNPTEIKDFVSDYYFAPWSRYQSYGVGVVFGFILWRCRGRLPIPKIANLCLWAVSGALLLSVLYGPYNGEAGKHLMSVAEAAIYNGWARVAWATGLGYIILACCLGRGGWVNEFLSWPGFVPLSRMTYCAYLVHPVVINIVSSSHKNKIQWDVITYIYMFLTFVTMSYTVAFLFSLAFEAPFMLIDKKFLTGRLSKKETSR